MKPQLIQVPSKSDFSFRVTDEIVPFFYNPFHYHMELELVYIVKSTGTRFIGDAMDSFSPGELVLVGPNVPHCWKNDMVYFDKKSNLKAQAIVVHFELNFLGSSFWDLPEMKDVKHLLWLSNRGVFFSKEVAARVKEKLIELKSLNNSERIVKMLEVLSFLSKDEGAIILSRTKLDGATNDKSLSRLNRVIDYISSNYTCEITVEKVSDIAHLTPNAFCRYFKKHTRKTFKEFVNEMRIGHACRLIQENKMKMSQIAFASGYNSTAHFIRMFKKQKGMLPSKYRSAVKVL